MSSQSLDPDYIEASDALTTQLRDRLTVGLSPNNYADAQSYAWEVAKRRGVPQPAKARELERFRYGANPLTGYGVVIMWDPTPLPPQVTALLTGSAS